MHAHTHQSGEKRAHGGIAAPQHVIMPLTCISTYDFEDGTVKGGSRAVLGGGLVVRVRNQV